MTDDQRITIASDEDDAESDEERDNVPTDKVCIRDCDMYKHVSNRNIRTPSNF